VGSVNGEIALKYNLEKDWLNDGVKGFISNKVNTEVFKEFSNLTVSNIDAEGLLAMKLTSARRKSSDMDDSITLMKHLGIDDQEQLFDIVKKYTYEDRQTPTSYFFTLETFEQYKKQLMLEQQNIKHEDRYVPNSDELAFNNSEEDIPNSSVEKGDKKQELFNLIKSTAENYTANPESIAELFQFGANFYNYSLRNNILINAQNSGATYVQSFKAWKDMDYPVNKGQKGIKILVPVKTTFLMLDDDNTVQLKYATKAQKEAYKRGEIEGKDKLFFKVGYVFDISQTNFPKDRYPELFSMGYPSVEHANVIKGLKDYSLDHLGCPVSEEDVQSISLRGLYYPFGNRIVLNDKLEDSEKLSTLSHELGHALIHNNPEFTDKSTAQEEFEADAMSIMLQSHLGFELTDSRKGHLAAHYTALVNAINETPDITPEQANKQVQGIFSSVFNTFKENIESIQLSIRKYMPEQKIETELKREERVVLGRNMGGKI